MDLTSHSSDNNTPTVATLFTGGGNMGQLMQTFDWTQHPLGDPTHWPTSLQTAIRMMLLSGYPMFIWWSDALYMFHNDAYAPTLVGKHEQTLGAKAREVWADVWPQLGGVIDDVLSNGTAFYAEDMLVIPQRKGFREETYWTFSYSPLPDDKGIINGIFCVCSDVTEKVLSSRRMKTLQEVSQAAHSLQTIEQVCQHVIGVLEQNEDDLPFSALYLLDPTGRVAYLKCQTHFLQNLPSVIELPFSATPLSPGQGLSSEIDLSRHIAQELRLLPADQTAMNLENSPDSSLVKGIVLPLANHQGWVGFFVAGVSPMLEYNMEYKQFHHLLSKQLTSLLESVANREGQQRQAQALEAERNELYSLFEQAPVAITILEGENYLVRLANQAVLTIWARSKDQVIGKSLFEAMPEIRNQGLEELLEGVRRSGKSHVGKELPVEIDRYGQQERVYFNFVYHPIRDRQGQITQIAVVATDVSELVFSRQKVEAKALQMQRSNSELQQVKDALEHLNRELEERVRQRTLQLEIAQQQAEKQRNQIYQLFLQAPAGIALLSGPDLIYQMANEIYYQILGRNSQILGKPGREAFPEGVEQGIWDIVDRVYATGEEYIGKEFRAFIDMEGKGRLTEQYYDFVFQPVKEGGEVVTGILITVLNVTHQVVTRKALMEQESYFRQMADKVPAMIWMTRPDGQCTYLNKSWYEYTGQIEKEALGFGWLSATHPEDVSVSEQVFLTANARQQPFSLLYRLRGKDGSYRWFLDKGEPKFDGEGAFEGYVGAVLDVHEGQVAQQRLHLSVKAGKVGIWEWDVVHNRAIYSELLQEMFGFEKGHFNGEFEQAYQVYQQVIHPEDRQLVNEQVEKAFSNREAEFYVEFRIVRPSGEIAWIAERGDVIFDEKGPLAMNGTCIDITKRKQAEETSQRMAEELAAANEELRAANEEIQAANEELSQSNRQLLRTNVDLDNFIYTASHDLKAPISNIEGLMHTLLRSLSTDSLASERVGRITKLMGESVERFKRTITSLTEVVKLQKENNAEAVLVDLLEMIEEVRLDLAPQLEATKAHLEVNIASCPWVRFSKKNLRSVIYNLLSNALKYRSPDRAPVVGIHCESSAEYYVLSVSDNGLGIAPERIGQLFTMFKRFHDHVEGSGIGLYMVKKMVENVGGKIEAESKQGIGSTFRVYLPR